MASITGLSGTGITLNAARVIITQTHATMLTATETQIEVGINSPVSSTSYATSIFEAKHYCYDSTSNNGTACVAASPSRFSPAPTYYFEATLQNDNSSGSTEAELFACTSATECTGGTPVSGSEVSVTGTTWKLKRSSAITLTAGKVYLVMIKMTTAGTGYIANAKIILVQSDATNGISGVETIQMYANTGTPTTTSYAITGHPNSFTSGSFSGTLTYYNESTNWVADAKEPSGTGKTRITDGGGQQLGEVTTTSTTQQRTRSGSLGTPSDAVFDSQIECTSCANRTMRIGNEWLIIQAQSMPVPEIAIFALPAMLFLPKIVSWWKRRGRDKKERGKNKFERPYLVSLATLNVNWNSNISKILGHRINGFKW